MTSNPVAHARSLAVNGRADQAIALLTSAGDHGNVDALMQMAVWALTGQYHPRDFARARLILRRAVTMGHVDGALMEIALTANGTGGKPDWPAALRLLEAAALHDHVAAGHLQLVRRMAIDTDGLPTTPPRIEYLSTLPRIMRLPGFLSPQECAHIAGAAGDLLEPASILDPISGRRIVHPIRRSDEMALGPTREDLVVRAINLRVAAATVTHVDQGEPLTVLRYKAGDEYRPHLDTIARTNNQRIRTVLLYLNGGFPGGETEFPMIGLSVQPAGGDALIFDTLNDDGSPDQLAQHAGRPIVAGSKWVATRWIRDQPIDPWAVTA